MINNNGPMTSVKTVAPDPKRISLSSGFKRIYGIRGWLELSSALPGLVIWLVVVGVTLWVFRIDVLRMVLCSTGCKTQIFANVFSILLVSMIVLAIANLAMDMVIQKFLFLREQRMTDSERKKDLKEDFGSPEMRKERKRLQNVAVTNQPFVGKAKTAMCFYHGDALIGLSYQPDQSPVPRIAIKSTIASMSRDIMSEFIQNDVAVIENKQVVQTCLSVELGDPIKEIIFVEIAETMNRLKLI